MLSITYRSSGICILWSNAINQARAGSAQRIGPKVRPNFRKARCVDSRTYSDLCAFVERPYSSRRTHGAVGATLNRMMASRGLFRPSASRARLFEPKDQRAVVRWPIDLAPPAGQAWMRVGGGAAAALLHTRWRPFQGLNRAYCSRMDPTISLATAQLRIPSCRPAFCKVAIASLSSPLISLDESSSDASNSSNSDSVMCNAASAIALGLALRTLGRCRAANPLLVFFLAIVKHH